MRLSHAITLTTAVLLLGCPRPRSTQLSSIELAPENGRITKGSSLDFVATGFFDDGSVRDVTQEVVWQVEDGFVAAADDAVAGRVKGLEVGSTVVRAVSGDVRRELAFSVVGGSIVRLEIGPAQPFVPVGLSLQLAVSAVRADGRVDDVTRRALYSVMGSSTVSMQDSSPGVVTGVSPGRSELLVSFDGVSATVTVEVTDATIDALAISPVSPTLAAGTSVRLHATASLSDGRQLDVSEQATWASSAERVAFVSTLAGERGTITGRAPGIAEVSVSLKAHEAATAVTVTDATIARLELAPTALTLAKGTSASLAAQAIFSDGTRQAVGTVGSWRSDQPSVATVDPSGNVRAVEVGLASVRFDFQGHFVVAPVTVTAAELTSIELSPPSLLVAAGTSARLTATGRFTDGTVQDLSGAVVWTSSDGSVVNVSNVLGRAGEITGLRVGSATVSAAVGQRSATVTVTVSAALLRQLVLSPAPLSLPLGASEQLVATGLFSDGSSQDVTSQASWSSSAPSVAGVDPLTARVTALSVGTAVVIAELQGVQGRGDVTVNAAVLRRFEVTPPNPTLALGTTYQLAATGVYSDGSTRDLTALATWSSVAPTVVTTSNAAGSEGLVRAVSVGTTRVEAAYLGQRTSVPVEVTPAVLLGLASSQTSITVPVGVEVDLLVSAAYSDGTSQDVTSQATWTEVDASVATVSNAAASKGRVRGVAVGSTFVDAAFGGRTTSVHVTVTAAALRGLSLSPSSTSLPAGRTQRFVATGTFSDGTTRDVSATVAWSTSGPALTVSPSGLVQAVTPGLAEVVVTEGALQARAQVTITQAELVSLGITPAQPVVPLGLPLQLTVTGVYSDGTTQVLTSQAVWSSSAPAVASVSNAMGSAGRVVSLSVGDTVITASLSGTSATTTLTVSAAALDVIELTPASARIAVGTFARFNATGRFTDGTTQDVTNVASWSVSDSLVASASNAPGNIGRVDGLAGGSVSVRASYRGVVGTAALDVVNTPLVRLDVSPASPSAPAGLNQPLAVQGTFADGSTQDLTSLVSWSTSNASIVTVSPAGLAHALVAGSATVSATALGVTGSATFVVTNALLVGLDVAPASLSLPRGLTGDLVATGRFTDGSTADVTSQVAWSVANPAIVSVSNAMPFGRATALALGRTQVTASLGAQSASIELTVTAAVLQQLTVSPASASVPRGLTVAFYVTGLFSDGSSSDLTEQVSWSSSAPAIASVSNVAGTRGAVQALQLGSTTITAAQGPVSVDASVTVTAAVLASLQLSPPSPVVPRGLERAMVATGLYTDGTTQDLTSSATWASSNPGIASVSNASGSEGVVTANAQGLVTITATFGPRSGSVQLTVSPAVLRSIQLTPSNPSVPAGLQLGLTATGVYSDSSTQDVTSQVAWSSSDQAIAVVSNASGSEGLVTGRVAGSCTLSALLDGVTATTTFTVSPAVLQQLQLTPPNPSRPRGLQTQLTATGVFSDGSTRDLTAQTSWSSSAPVLVAVSNGSGSEGLASALNVGQATLTATLGAVVGTTLFTVTPAQLVRVDVSPASVTLPLGTVRQFQALGRYTDGTTQNLTSQASWSSSDGAVLDVSNAPGSVGLATTLAVGSAQVTMTFGAFSAVASVTITQAALASIELTPTGGSTALGFTRQFIAVGVYTDSTTQVLTSQVTWSTSDASKALISNAANSRGLLSTVAVGVVTVEATFNGVTGSTTHTITAASLVSIDLSASSPSVGVGLTVQLTAMGNYSDGSSQDLTTSVTWSSVDTNVAQVSNAVGTKGLVTGIGAGSTTVRAQSGSVSRTIAVTVTP